MDHEQAPAPRVKARSGPSLVWLIPLVAALIGGWLVVKTLSEQGPRITVTFETAEGIEAGKTRIKYKNLDIGVVESIEFSDDFRSIIIHGDMAPEAEPFLRRGTRFWVVKPRLGLRGVSGLSTLISGAYIEMEPGKGAERRHFTGLESPPVVRAEEAGKRIVLLAEELGSVDIGSPVYYQGILAGEVLGYELGSDRRSVFIHAFVKSPYAEMVRGNTRFWNVSGVDLSFDSEGVQVRTESIQSMLFGGIAFDTPSTLEPADQAVEDLVFTLHPSRESIAERSFTRKVRFVLFFEGSVRGLNVGAPVEFKGIQVGRVADIRLEFDERDTSFRIPVLIEIEPQRVTARDRPEATDPYRMLQTLVERGLRARLQTGSLLTGQLYVELDMHPGTPVRLVAGEDSPVPELPTIPATLAQITDAVRTFLAKLEEVDVAAIGAALQGTLEGSERLLASDDAREAVAGLNASLEAFRSALTRLDRRVDPVGEGLEQALGSGRRALEQVNGTLERLNRVLAPDSPAQYRFNRMTEELAEMARAIRTLVDLLERQPQSVLFGKPPPGGE